MKKTSNMFQVMKNLTYIAQVGISVAVPLILCIFVTSWLQKRFELGTWIVLFGIIFGVGSSACSLIQFFKYMAREAKKGEDERKKY
ncbi:MAG: AtpZ/AtpI family protein [Oscillospiraceae bacterium]